MDRSNCPSWRRVILIGIFLMWALAVGIGWLVVPRLVLDGFDGASLPSINSRIESHRRAGEAAGEDRSREWYRMWAIRYAYKGSVLSTLLSASVLAVVVSPRLRNRCRRFLIAPSAALNLGILRVVVFATLILLLYTEPIAEFADWDRSNFEWPSVGGLLLQHLPINGELVTALLPVAFAASALAMIGMFSRSSALVACLLSFYLLGIPQSSGKVNHTMHHVWMIAMLMACSRCGDAFSIDSLRLAIRRADSGTVRHLARSVNYGMPIRLSMLVIANCYFFPGFWKLASNGLTWIFSDNLHNQLLQKWFELETFEPPVPLYELPGFLALGALTSVIFEIGFPLALLWRPTRVIWACLGILFHNMTRLLMNISFSTMQAMYVIFVDWQRVLARIGRLFAADPLVVLYDGERSLSRRATSLLLSLDWFRLLVAIDTHCRHDLLRRGLEHVAPATLLGGIQAATFAAGSGWQVSKGYSAYKQFAWRVPVLWPLVPFLCLPLVAWSGQRIHSSILRRQASSCEVNSNRLRAPASRRWSLGPLLFVAMTLLVGQLALGIGRVRTAWPVACYPLFDTLSTSTVLWPEFEAIYSDGRIEILDDDPLRNFYSESRYVPKLKQFVSAPLGSAETRAMLREYIRVWEDAGAIGTSPPTRIDVYIGVYHLTGPKRPAPAKRTLIAQFDWPELEPSAGVPNNVATP
jgi:hypothetical protein